MSATEPLGGDCMMNAFDAAASANTRSGCCEPCGPDIVEGAGCASAVAPAAVLGSALQTATRRHRGLLANRCDKSFNRFIHAPRLRRPCADSFRARPGCQPGWVVRENACQGKLRSQTTVSRHRPPRDCAEASGPRTLA